MAVHELFAYLCVRNAAGAIEFYTKAFGAHEKDVSPTEMQRRYTEMLQTK